MKIWCLFSQENNYDQPDNCLVAWWREKPTPAQVYEFFSPGHMTAEEDDKIIAIVDHLTMERIQNTDWWLQEVPEGKPFHTPEMKRTYPI